MGRKIATTSVIVALGLAATVGGGAYAHQQRVADEIASLVDRVVQTQQDERAAVDALGEVITRAEQRLTDDEGKVADPATLTALAQAVEAAKTEVVDAAAVPEGATVEQAKTALDAATAEVDAVAQAHADLSAALLAQMASNVRFRLDEQAAQVEQAKAALTGAVTAAHETLTGSEGKVTDDAVRVALTEAINAAQSAIDADVDADSFYALDRAATGYADATEKVQAATTTVTDAVTAKAEADRKAAEEAAARSAAQRAATRKSAPKHLEAAPSNTQQTAPSNAASGSGATAQAAEAEAARLGVRIDWNAGSGGTSGHYGVYDPAIPGRIAVNPSLIGRASRLIPIVRHEAAHSKIHTICGSPYPSIAGVRHENVTDAYADIYLGGLRWKGYGYNSNDADIARKIHAGQCTGGSQSSASLKVGDRVRTTFEESSAGVIHGIVTRVFADATRVDVQDGSGKLWEIPSHLVVMD